MLILFYCSLTRRSMNNLHCALLPIATCDVQEIIRINVNPTLNKCKCVR